jgi:hypothetical protein
LLIFFFISLKTNVLSFKKYYKIGIFNAKNPFLPQRGERRGETRKVAKNVKFFTTPEKNRKIDCAKKIQKNYCCPLSTQAVISEDKANQLRNVLCEPVCPKSAL